MSTLIVVGWIVAYLLIGALVARASIPRLWVRVRLRLNGNSEAYIHQEVVGGAVARWLLWPVMGLYEILARQIDATDPQEQDRRLREQEERIRELERDLGVGGSR